MLILPHTLALCTGTAIGRSGNRGRGGGIGDQWAGAGKRRAAWLAPSLHPSHKQNSNKSRHAGCVWCGGLALLPPRTPAAGSDLKAMHAQCKSMPCDLRKHRHSEGGCPARGRGPDATARAPAQPAGCPWIGKERGKSVEGVLRPCGRGLQRHVGGEKEARAAQPWRGGRGLGRGERGRGGRSRSCRCRSAETRLDLRTGTGVAAGSAAWRGTAKAIEYVWNGRGGKCGKDPALAPSSERSRTREMGARLKVNLARCVLVHAVRCECGRGRAGGGRGRPRAASPWRPQPLVTRSAQACVGGVGRVG